MAEKAKEFTEKGSEIYHGNIPDGADTEHPLGLSYKIINSSVVAERLIEFSRVI